MDTGKSAGRLAVPAIAAAALLVLVSCRLQRLPGPMKTVRDPLPPGNRELFAAGPEEVVLVRHADSVLVRPVELPAGYPLSFYDRQRRITAGSWVHGSSSARFEIFWPHGATLVASGATSGVVGSVSRGEPAFVFFEMERATMNFSEVAGPIELLGGALVSATSGPLVVERLPSRVLRLTNRSKQTAQVAFREANFRLDPGQGIDLPLLAIGGRPEPGRTALEALPGAAFDVRSSRPGDARAIAGGVQVRADGDQVVHALGVAVRLSAGESATFGGLEPPAAPAVAPAPAPAASVTPEEESE